MRFGNWRGVPLALSLAAMLGWGLATSVRADGWHLQYTIPREVPAYDYTTGGEYYAPPVPYGHYAKDYPGEAAKAMGCVTGYAGQLHGCLKDLWDKTVGLFHKCGDGCGLRREFRARGAGWSLLERFGAGSEEAFCSLPCLDRGGNQPGSTGWAGHRFALCPVVLRRSGLHDRGPSFASGPPPMPVLRRIRLWRLRRSRNW